MAKPGVSALKRLSSSPGMATRREPGHTLGAALAGRHLDVLPAGVIVGKEPAGPPRVGGRMASVGPVELVQQRQCLLAVATGVRPVLACGSRYRTGIPSRTEG